VDRSILDGDDIGFVKVFVKEGTDKVMGATIVHPHAGDLISEITLLMHSRLGLASLANVIHPYPTQSEAIRKIGDAYNRSRLTPLVRVILRKIVSSQK
jgi:pyruvate/2-oxoglutarate dehydrogenase complex dihydrolipoamide dehydrogenase (E3) component